MAQAEEELICQEIRGVLARLASGDAVIRVPASLGLYERDGSNHFHDSPEFFIQIGGTTHFRFPREELMLRPGEVCIVPAGLPHYETALAGDAPFRNVVGMLAGGASGLAAHLAEADDRGAMADKCTQMDTDTRLWLRVGGTTN